MGAFDPLVERFSRDVRAVRDALDSRPTLRLGTVTEVAPIRVHLDGDTAPLPASPRTLVPVSPGDRVTVAHQRRTVTILGVVGGSSELVAAGDIHIGSTTITTTPLTTGAILFRHPVTQAEVTFAVPPRVVCQSAVFADGRIVHTHPVSITTTGFQARMRTNTGTANDFATHYIASGARA